MMKGVVRAACLLTLVAGAGVAHAADEDYNAAVLREYNFARTHPQEYAEQLRQYRKSFDGLVSHDPSNPPTGVLTAEGVAAVDEAIAFMERQKPMAPLIEAPMLDKAAVVFTAEQGPSGMTGHLTPVSAGPQERLVAIGGKKFVAEVIGYGQYNPIGAVRQLIIDDGEPHRGHRYVMFQQSSFQYAGVSCGVAHARFVQMCAIEIAEQPDGGPTLPGAHPVILVTQSSKLPQTNVVAMAATPSVGPVASTSTPTAAVMPAVATTMPAASAALPMTSKASGSSKAGGEAKN